MLNGNGEADVSTSNSRGNDDAYVRGRSCTRVYTCTRAHVDARKAEGKRALHSPRMAAADIQLISFLRDYRFERGGKSREKRRKRQDIVALLPIRGNESSPVPRGRSGNQAIAIEFACLVRRLCIMRSRRFPGMLASERRAIETLKDERDAASGEAA